MVMGSDQPSTERRGLHVPSEDTLARLEGVTSRLEDVVHKAEDLLEKWHGIDSGADRILDKGTKNGSGRVPRDLRNGGQRTGSGSASVG